MASCVTKVITGPGLLLLTTLSAVAAGGSLSFSGTVIQDPCLVIPGNTQFAVSCIDKGSVQTQPISVQQATRGHVALPGVADVSLTYVNPQKSLAVVLVDYN